MNLLCPSCQKMLQVSEQAAGQQMRCPLCNNTFTVPPLPDAPSLAPSPLPPLPPPPAPGAEVYTLADDPNPPLPTLTPAAPPPPLPVPTRTPAPPPPPPVVGDYTKLRSIVISPRVVPWIAPIAMGVLFLLTLFPWLFDYKEGYNAWSLGFGDASKHAPGGALFIFYDLFVLLGMSLSIASLLLHLKVIPDNPSLQPMKTWGPVIVLFFVGGAYLLLFFSVLVNLFDLPGKVVWLSFWGWLAETTHCIAVIGLLLEMWLQLRGPTRPPPRIDIHT